MELWSFYLAKFGFIEAKYKFLKWWFREPQPPPTMTEALEVIVKLPLLRYVDWAMVF